jgi:hypothetical protein
VKKSKKGKFEVPSEADFIALLEGDRRFQFIEKHKNQLMEFDRLAELEGQDEALKLESMGFSPDDMVRLKQSRLDDDVDELIDEDDDTEKQIFFRDDNELDTVKIEEEQELSENSLKGKSLTLPKIQIPHQFKISSKKNRIAASSLKKSVKKKSQIKPKARRLGKR